MELSDRARILRKNGKSFREIAKELDIAVSTAYLWSNNVKISLDQKEHLRQKSLKALQISREKAQKIKREKYVKEVRKNFKNGLEITNRKITGREFLLVGASLYWAEGFKRDNRLGFANSDLAMIKLILTWLIDVLKVDKECIRLRVGINADFRNKISNIEKYWSDNTGIPTRQFNKPFFQNTTLKRDYSRRGVYYGVLRIRAIGQNDKFRKILGMVEGLRNVEQKFIK